MGKPLIEYITGALPDRRVRFVFPAGIPALFWAREAAKVTLKPVATGRFIAWDTFKSRVLSVKQPEKQAINQAIRTLFASNLLQENRQNRILFEYIPPKYADSYTPFISSLSKLLPGLDNILKKRSEAASTETDAYFADLTLIHERYSQFLDEHLLYEAAWNRAAFTKSGDVWMLFYPELAEDWEEYSKELKEISEKADSSITIIPLAKIAPPPRPPKNAAGAPAGGGVSAGVPLAADASAAGGVQAGGGARDLRQTGEILEHAGKFIHFRSTADEYKWLALVCRQLIDKSGLCPEDICISVAGTGSTERLAHEFRLYGITLDVRQGKPLPKHSGGRIFSELSSCPPKWPYQELKNLLLDKAFPWKGKEFIDTLMEFGLAYHCVSGFSEGRDIDVWEKTFDQLLSRHLRTPEEYAFMGMPLDSLQKFYKDLKRDIEKLVNASNFNALRTNWGVFQDNHFDKAAFDPRTNLIMGKAISSLQELIEQERQFPELYTKYAGRAFPIFQSFIQEETYVFESKERGIPVYAYKVAAGIAPLVHFIINMNQDDATIVYDGRSSFLREDRKDRLGIEDRDISAEFIKAYAVSGAFTVFTVADRTFSGPTVPHRKLKELLSGEAEAKDLAVLPDSYATEMGILTSAPVNVPFSYPSVLQKQGKAGFDILQQKPEARDLRFSAIGDASLRAAIEERLCNQKKFRDQRAGKGADAASGKDAPGRAAGAANTAELAGATGAEAATGTAEPAGVIGVAVTTAAVSATESPHPPDTRAGISPTDLDEYLRCPFMWVLQRGLGVKEKQTEIETLDQRNIGNLYHAILEELFNHIQKESGRFRAEDIAVYKESLKKMTTRAIDKAQMREGYFQKPVYDMLRPRIEASLMDYLENDKEAINGCEIAGTEYHLQKPCEAAYETPDGAQAKAALDLLGRADLVLRADDGSFVLTDFKTNSMPPPKDIFTQDDDEFPKNVQMASYIAMLETPRRSSGGEADRDAPAPVKKARFYSIDGREFRNVVSAEDDKPRSGYDKEVAAVDTVIATAAEAMRAGAYMTPKNPPRKDCLACPVSSVCRRPFMGEQSAKAGG